MMKLSPFWLCLLLLAACAPPLADESLPDEVLATPDTARQSQPQLTDLLSQNAELVLFVGALNSTGIMATLQTGGPYTILAPDNGAFTRLGMATSQIDAGVLRTVISHHVIPGRLSAADLAGPVETLAGDTVRLTSESGVTRAGFATVTVPDLTAADGMVHVIDALLLPEPAPDGIPSAWNVLAADGRFSRLAALMAGRPAMYLLHFGAPDAFLAPVDAAFDDLAAGTLELLLPTPDDVDFWLQYYTLAQDGWPTGTPLMLADLVEIGTAQTRSGSFGYGFAKLPVRQLAAGEVTIDGALVVAGDLVGANSVIHGLDTVLMPPELMEHLP